MICYLIEDLSKQNKVMEAKGIMRRHQVECYVKQDVCDKLNKITYDEKQDSSLSKYDALEPLSRPKQEYLELPSDLKIVWIETEKDVSQLEDLLSEELIGVDSEWRPQLSQYHKTKPSLF